MNLKDLDELLIQWSYWYCVRDRPRLDADGYELSDDAAAMGSHPLARAMEYAPGRNASTSVPAMVRTTARRRYMARYLAECGVHSVPACYVDTQAGNQTRPHLGTPRYPTEPDTIPKAVQRVEAAVRILVLCEPDWGYTLRARYCQRGESDGKAAWVSERLGKKVTPRAYHALLAQAKLVLLGRLASE